MPRLSTLAASAIALVLFAPATSSGQGPKGEIDVEGSWTGTVTWDRVLNDGAGTVKRWTGKATFKGTGKLAPRFDTWRIDVDWTETHTRTYDGSLGGEPCSESGTGSGSAIGAGWIAFDLIPALSELYVEIDGGPEEYAVHGDCSPFGTGSTYPVGIFSSPDVALPDGRATTTMEGEAEEDGGANKVAWSLTRKPDADCDGTPDEADGQIGRPCNFTKTRIDQVERTRRKLRIDGIVDPYYGPEQEMTVALFRRRGGSFRKVATNHPVVDLSLDWKTAFARPEPGRCRVKAYFPGSRVAEPSRAKKTFDC